MPRLLVLALLAGFATSAAAQQPAAPSLDYEFFKARVQPVFTTKRPGNARCVSCHDSGTPMRLQPLPAGAATWSESVKALAPGGRIVTCGATTGSSGTLDLVRLFSEELTILGSRGGSASELHQLLAVAARAGIKPVISTRLPLAHASEAHRVMERGDFFGKILLIPEGSH